MRFPKSDLRGYFVLAILVLIVACCNFFFRQGCVDHRADGDTTLNDEKQAEVAQFLDELQQAEQREVGTSRGETFCKDSLFCFDPNTADSATLLRLGFGDKHIRNILKYRAKGGRWRDAAAFSRLYGLSEQQFNAIRPYIRIAPTPQKNQVHRAPGAQSSPRRAHNYHPKVVKFAHDTVLNLNTADTAQLKMIPGIGSYYASRICRYRVQLGGFVSCAQLKEIEGLPEGVEKWFRVDTIAPRQIAVNTADFKTLVRHPYLNYEQCKVIANYIRKYGKIRSWSDLSASEHFTPRDVERLKPYFSFE